MKKLFTNDVFFASVIVLAALGEAIYAVIDVIYSMDYLMDALSMIGISACLITLYVSYRRHEKNVMKGMLGALLMAQVLNAAESTTYSKHPILAYSYLVLSVAIFITHFSINRTHGASPFKIKLNQILLGLVAIDVVIWEIESISSYSGFIKISNVADMVAIVCMCSAIICVETRLDAYRIDREAAGWTEETGYPEGYVHEFEKKNNK